MEPCRAEGLGPPGLRRDAESAGLRFRNELETGPGGRQPDRGPGRQPDRAVRASAIARTHDHRGLRVSDDQLTPRRVGRCCTTESCTQRETRRSLPPHEDPASNDAFSLETVVRHPLCSAVTKAELLARSRPRRPRCRARRSWIQLARPSSTRPTRRRGGPTRRRTWRRSRRQRGGLMDRSALRRARPKRAAHVDRSVDVHRGDEPEQARETNIASARSGRPWMNAPPRAEEARQRGDHVPRRTLSRHPCLLSQLSIPDLPARAARGCVSARSGGGRKSPIVTAECGRTRARRASQRHRKGGGSRPRASGGSGARVVDQCAVTGRTCAGRVHHEDHRPRTPLLSAARAPARQDRDPRRRRCRRRHAVRSRAERGSLRPWSSTGPSWTQSHSPTDLVAALPQGIESGTYRLVVVRAPGNASASMDVTIGGGETLGSAGPWARRVRLAAGPRGPAGDGTSGTARRARRGGRLDLRESGPGGQIGPMGLAGPQESRPGGPDRGRWGPQVRRESRAWRARPADGARKLRRVSSRSRSRRPSVRAPPGPRRSWPRARVARRRSQAALAPRSPTRSSAPTPRTMAVTGSASSASRRPYEGKAWVICAVVAE